MKNINRKILITMIVMIGVFMSSANVMAAVSATVDLDPEVPKRKSTVSFTADITTDETIQTVTLYVQECNDQLCFEPVSDEMEESGGVYNGQITLTRSDTVYIQYWLEIETDQQTNTTAYIKVYLDTSSTNGGTNGGSDDNNTPGFELFTILIAIVIGAILVKRKRSR